MITHEEMKKEVQIWADKIKVKPMQVHIRQMKNKWASCSSRGRLTFSYALLNEAQETRAKAIVHELLHMKYPNHGKMFKTLFISHLSKNGINCSIKEAGYGIR